MLLTVTAGDCKIKRFDIHPLFWLPLRLIIGIFKPRNKISANFQELLIQLEIKLPHSKKAILFLQQPCFGWELTQNMLVCRNHAPSTKNLKI